MAPKSRMRDTDRSASKARSTASSVHKSRKSKKRSKRLSKKQVEYLVRNLRTIDTSIMRAFVMKDAESRGSPQFTCYKARYELWCSWKTSSKLDDLLAHLSGIFVDLFDQHRSGSEPFARFLVSWHQALGRLACSKTSSNTSRDLWLCLSRGHPTDITHEDRSALVFLVGASCYSFMRKQVWSLQSMWRTTHIQAVRQDTDTEPDDDTSLYRLFGFALFVGISCRKKVVFGRLKNLKTREYRQRAYKLMEILLSLVEKDKSVLPACIKFQDRGKMIFPEQNFLPFARSCSQEIKKHLRPSKYHVLGHKLVLITKLAVLDNDDLLNAFRMFVRYHRTSQVDDNHIVILFKEIVTRVVNTISNSFFQCMDLLDRISTNKGVDAHVFARQAQGLCRGSRE